MATVGTGWTNGRQRIVNIVLLLWSVASSQLAAGVRIVNNIDPWLEYDFIVVGGGGAGCVVSRVLSDAGYETLLIERGDVPRTTSTNSLYGLRDALANPRLTQPIVTTSGIRTHVANVLGGGTSVNLGIWIEEDQEYFDALLEYLVTVSGEDQVRNWQSLLRDKDEAYEWVRAFMTDGGAQSDDIYGASEPSDVDIHNKYTSVMEKVVGDWFGEYIGSQPKLKAGKSWSAFITFMRETVTDENGAKRKGELLRQSAANIVMAANEHLTVLVNTTVDAVVPPRPYIPYRRGETPHEVTCVRYHATLPQEPGIVGTLRTNIVTADEWYSPTADLANSAAFSQSAAHLKSLQTSYRYGLNDNTPTLKTKMQRDVCLKGTQAILAGLSIDKSTGKPLKGEPTALDLYGPTATNITAIGREIILCAGAVYSPWLLFNSGIGPKDETDKLGVINYVNNPWIGKNLQDRPVVGLGLELRNRTSELDIREVEAMITHNVALALKEDIEDGARLYNIGLANEIDSRSFQGASKAFSRPSLNPLYYSNYWSPATLFHRKAMGFEDIYGGDVIEGILAASRLIFPPELRNSALADYVLDVLTVCGNLRRRRSRHTGLFGHANPLTREEALGALCGVADVLKTCTANSALWFTFLTHIKSRGSISVAYDGGLVVDPGYLDDEADRRDLAQNFQAMLQMLIHYSGLFSEVFQPVTLSQCPAHDFRSAQKVGISVANFVSQIVKLKPRDASQNQHIPFATEPQVVPNIDDDNSLLKFINNHMTSMWHLAGSISLGVVLDDEFHIENVRGLSVIDASALPIHTRMNPTSTIMALAKLAAEHKLRHLL